MSYKLPQRDDDFDYYGSSSQDESRGSQGNRDSYIACSGSLVLFSVALEFHALTKLCSAVRTHRVSFFRVEWFGGDIV